MMDSCMEYYNEGVWYPQGKTASGRWYYKMEYTWDASFYMFYDPKCGSHKPMWMIATWGPPSTVRCRARARYLLC